MRSSALFVLLLLVGCGRIPSIAFNNDTDIIGETDSPDSDDTDTDIDTADTAIPETTWYHDSDGDGFGNLFEPNLAVVAPYGYVADNTDCDDSNASIHPGAGEVCDEADNNCNGETDESVTSTFYQDADSDGFGDINETQEACKVPEGYVENADDCNDADPVVFPGADETCDNLDNDCDGVTDEDAVDAITWYPDLDGDGFGDGTSSGPVTSCVAPLGYVADGTDCDDIRNDTNPGAVEVCDLADNDCDGVADEGVTETFYADADGDNYGDASEASVVCVAPTGHVLDSTDCDDANAAAYPGASESCDSVDNDCDGVVDESDAIDADTWYRDADNDSFGDSADSFVSCSAPGGYISDSADCDDTDSDVHPGADEFCNEIDDDCDGVVDEEVVDAATWYRDADGDSYGDASDAFGACVAPTGFVADPTDCDDTRSDKHPGATETNCADPTDYNCDGSTGYANADGDAYAACNDCNDADPDIHPGAAEYCNGIDDDCNGVTDENSAVDAFTWYRDADEDGYGDPTVQPVHLCENLPGYVADNTDCDDMLSSVNPAADEYCDSSDNNCNGQIDEEAVDATTWYQDRDSDGYGVDGVTEIACEQPSGFAIESGDCEDGDHDFHPNAPETDCTDSNDYNCDGHVGYADVDQDGLAACQECNDNDASVYPGADEVCDGVDNDCDGITDRGAIDEPEWYADMDQDGYGDPAHNLSSCTQPYGYVDDASDCNDGNVNVHPNAPEFCDGEDDDCDGTIDENDAVDATAWYVDADRDGHGTGNAVFRCYQPAGYEASGTDPNDANNTVYPGALDICDGLDNDGDGTIDDNDVATWYSDGDGDGYGSPSWSVADCHVPAGSYVLSNTDCDDTNRTTNPAAQEICNGVDDDCDGSVDDGVTVTYYHDSDGDRYGDSSDHRAACSQPTGYVTDNTDCDDGDDESYPSADEYCDGWDNDCDGRADENSLDATDWYQDADDDGYGDENVSVEACEAPGDQFVGNDIDCDDTDPTTNPLQFEVCDRVDNDCDGTVDESDAIDASTWYEDDDGDGFGGSTSTPRSCTQPGNSSNVGGDCNDSDTDFYPGATESCDDPSDYNCDGQVGYVDADHDGVAACEDCDDTRALVYPGASEICDLVDNDCNGAIDENSATDATTWYLDQDGDGYGSDYQLDSCSVPAGYVTNNNDFDDTRATDYPGAPELCDGRDNDGDGVSDEGRAYYNWQPDADADGYGSLMGIISACTQPSGYVIQSSQIDCDDTNRTVYPGATELCDGIDNDCNGHSDDNVASSLLWYLDQDSDGFGSPISVTASCTAVPGYVPGNSSDCNDNNANMNPAVDEVCNGADDDCDGATDESATDATTWYFDMDGDGFGGTHVAVSCTALTPDWIVTSEDCNDWLVDVYPHATEFVDGIDNNCNGLVDE